ncbi:MAG: polysaccharide pyruvyl transferase family protein, partial [Methyloprofundus sp.]|nr:polysaccharide pyruvyl transferase family protein [Methyloprofundus sp.]
MKKIYLSGQNTFENRGCEAIVRSTVMLLRERYGEDIEILVPSSNIERDQKQWPESENYGVRFVQSYLPWIARYWVNLQRLPLRFLKQAGWPFPMPSWLKQQIQSVDLVLAIGGDNYSLDYKIPSMIMGVDKLAMDLGKPVVIWGASVGPFDKEPLFVPTITKHLSKMQSIGVRETISYSYLTEKLGLKNVELMADPAFTLMKEEFDVNDYWPKNEHGVIGLNISPLIEKYTAKNQDLRSEVNSFIKGLIDSTGMGVLLIPHVSSLSDSSYNCDYRYMSAMMQELTGLGASVKILPNTLNASQLKQVISKLRFFIGARTHSTIAALSSRVPTISIAYSVKAKGINKDIFGNEDPVLETPKVSKESLSDALGWLLKNENDLKSTLDKKVPELQKAVRDFVLTL